MFSFLLNSWSWRCKSINDSTVLGGCFTGIIPTGKVYCFVSSVAAVPIHFVPKSRQPNFMNGSCSFTSRTNSLTGKILLCAWRLRFNIVITCVEIFALPRRQIISYAIYRLNQRRSFRSTHCHDTSFTIFIDYLSVTACSDRSRSSLFQSATCSAAVVDCMFIQFYVLW